MACNKSSKLNSMFLAALLLMLTLITSTIVSASPIKGLINRVTQPDCRPTYGNPIYSDCQTALELIPHDQNPDPRFATPLWFVNRHPMDTDVLMSSPLRYAYGSCAIQLELLHNEDDHETWYNIAQIASQIVYTCVSGAENFGGTKPAGRGGNIAISVTGPRRCRSPTGQALSGASCPTTSPIQAPNKVGSQCSSPGAYCKTSSSGTAAGYRCNSMSLDIPELLFGALSTMMATAGSCVVA